ncbi:MAG: class I SAM-dependent methyltransferase [Chryseolinea sp.]
MDLYEEKNNQYFSHVRRDLIKLIPKKPGLKLLEVGAGGGHTLVHIKQSGMAAEVVGMELFEIPNSNQTNPLIDRFHVASIEDEVGSKQPDNYYDVILCGDVLEHLVDPWTVVNRMAKWLKRDGVLITSIPNIRIKSALKAICFKGDFRYTDAGTFDRTHLRFFCKKNMIELLTTPDLAVEAVYPNFQLTDYDGRTRLRNKLTFGLFEEFMALQFFLVARKK